MNEFLKLTFEGVALGSRYALVALGFVVVYRASGVINFAQGGFAMLGAYFAYNAHHTWGIPFYPSILVAMAGGALVGLVVEALILRRMVGKPPFVLIMVTIGLLIVIDQVVPSIWGVDNLDLGDPWGIQTVHLGGVSLLQRDLWTIGLAAAALLAFFAFFRFSRVGLAMRATALDQEAALAQGMSPRRVLATSWAIAGIVAALAGITLGAGQAQVRTSLDLIAFAAFPAIILGGLDSPGGAVVGGLVIGVTQVLAAGYQWGGQGFDEVLPYLVMIVILLVRPTGLWGTRQVRRV